MKRAILVAALLTACCSGGEAPLQTSIELSEVHPGELLDAANKGHRVLAPDGSFVIPRGIGRVWVDVGAHDLETTRHALMRLDDVLLIAIEPLEERWREWPEHPNLIAFPSRSRSSGAGSISTSPPATPRARC